MRRVAIVVLVAAFGAGTGFGYWGLPALSHDTTHAPALPEVGTGPGRAIGSPPRSRSLPAAVGPAITVGASNVPLRLDRCAVAALRNEAGSFIGGGRWVAPGRVLRPRRLNVVVVEESNCDPCARLLARLAIEHLGIGVDLIALGIGDDSGSHSSVAGLLEAGAGWLYVGGFDEHALLDGVFGKAATPSTLIVDRDGRILAGMQGLPNGDPDRVVSWLHERLTALGVAPGRDQGLVSPDLHEPHDPECVPVPPVEERPLVATRPREPRPVDGDHGDDDSGPVTDPFAVFDPPSSRGALRDPPSGLAPVPEPPPALVPIGPPPAEATPAPPPAPKPTTPAAESPLPQVPPDDEVRRIVALIRKRAPGCGKSGTVELAFVISPRGYIGDLVIVKSPTAKAAECAARIVRSQRFSPSRRGLPQRLSLSLK